MADLNNIEKGNMPSIDTQEIESELQVPLVSTEMARHLQVETESFNDANGFLWYRRCQREM